MDQRNLPQVQPGLFQFAAVPSSFFGLSAEPTLPAVGGYSDTDLERMRLALAQSGVEPDKLARIDEIRARRKGAPVDAAMMLLRPTPAKVQGVQRSADINPFGVLSDVLAPPQ